MDNLENYVTAASILVTTLLAFLALWQNRAAHKREHTFDVMLSRFTGDYVANLHAFAEKWISEGRQPPIGERQKEITELLNLYEFIAVAARNGILDANIIVQIRGGVIKRLFEYFHPYVEWRREIVGNDRPYEHLEWFVNIHCEKLTTFKG